jgi:hypothetical protein
VLDVYIIKHFKSGVYIKPVVHSACQATVTIVSIQSLTSVENERNANVIFLRKWKRAVRYAENGEDDQKCLSRTVSSVAKG